MMNMRIQNRLFELSYDVSRCEMLGRAIEMIVGAGSCSSASGGLREAVVGTLGEVLASLACAASERLGELADEIGRIEPDGAKP